MRLLAIVLAALPLTAQPAYELILKGGHVIDAKNGISAVRDVAIAGGRIAEVAASIDPAKALHSVDCRGLYVVPGLVDIHVHVYAGTGQKRAYSGDLSVYPDAHALPSGVTTVADAGSSGWRNFPDFRDRVISRSKTRVLAFVNIVGKGMGGGTVEQDVSDMDPKATAEQIKANRDAIIGVKTAHFAGPEWTAVDRAVEAGQLAGVPVMVDFGVFRKERPHEELVLQHLRPGDIYTHTFLPAVPMFDAERHVRPYLFEAQKRGVIFDVGHGAGSFVFRYAVPAMQQGFLPNSISTDLHYTSMLGGMKDMLNVMSKFLNMGMSLDDVVARSTWNPAREIHREELGNLSVGSPADVAVLRVVRGEFGFVDVYGARLRGDRKLMGELTVRDGKVVWDLNGLTRKDWDQLGEYKAQGDVRWDGTLSGETRRR